MSKPGLNYTLISNLHGRLKDPNTDPAEAILSYLNEPKNRAAVFDASDDEHAAAESIAKGLYDLCTGWGPAVLEDLGGNGFNPLKEIVRLAPKSPAFHMAAGLLAADWLEDGLAVPPELMPFVIERLRGKVPRKPTRGRSPRDFFLSRISGHAAKALIDTTRAKKSPAFEIVADALGCANYPLPKGAGERPENSYSLSVRGLRVEHVKRAYRAIRDAEREPKIRAD